MTSQEIQSLLEKQRAYYRSGATIPVKFRVEQLKKLYATVKKYQNEINDALKSDLGKSHYEGFMCESGLVLTEISYMIKHTRRFAKKTVSSELVFEGKSHHCFTNAAGRPIGLGRSFPEYDAPLRSHVEEKE